MVQEQARGSDGGLGVPAHRGSAQLQPLLLGNPGHVTLHPSELPVLNL